MRPVADAVRVGAPGNQGQPTDQQITKQFFHERKLTSELKPGKMKSLGKPMELTLTD